MCVCVCVCVCVHMHVLVCMHLCMHVPVVCMIRGTHHGEMGREAWKTDWSN